MIKLRKLMIVLLVCTLAIAGCEKDKNNTPTSTKSSPQPSTSPKTTELPEGKADQADAKSLPSTPPADTNAAPTEKPVPVPAAQPPKANISDVPEVDALNEQKAIAKTSYNNPDISSTIVPYLIANQQNLGACQDSLFEPDLSKTASETYRVGDNTYLAHFACGVSAYQSIQEYYLYENTNDKPIVTSLPLTYFYADLNGELVQSTERTIAGFSDYDSTTQTISIFTKGRGLGDCGSLGFYKLEGNKLVLERFLAKNECDGKYVDPIDYPQVYP